MKKLASRALFLALALSATIALMPVQGWSSGGGSTAVGRLVRQADRLGLTVGRARTEVRATMKQRFSWFGYGPGHVKPCKRLNPSRVRCGVESTVADLGLKGHVTAWSNPSGSQGQLRTKGRVRATNWDCVFIRHEPKRKCTHTRKWG